MRSSNKILTVAVVLLLLINIGLVVFMLTGKKKAGGRPPKADPFEMMVKELKMTEKQQADYKAMKEEHMKVIRPLFDSVRAAKTAFFGMVKDADVNDSLVNVYSERITSKQAEIDKLTFSHFKRVRTVFTPEQQPQFDAFIQKMMQRNKKDSAGKKEKGRD